MQVFIIALILHYFDPEYYMWIETDVSGYAIGGIFSLLTLDNLGLCYSIVFFSQKIILVETRYKTHNGKLLAIMKAFQTDQHNSKDCKHEIHVFMDYN